jgi:hypothetical protein
MKKLSGLFLCLAVMFFAVSTFAGSVEETTGGGAISGTVYQSDGITPLTGKNIGINVFTGSPCGSLTWIESTPVFQANGTYLTSDLPTGTYYLQAWSDNKYYGPKWWASPQSVRDCAGAQPIVVIAGQTVAGKNFQLDLGGAISGTLYQSDGVTPLIGKNISITAFTGSPCGSYIWFMGTGVDPATGTYTIPGLPDGTYYLLTWANNENYLPEWWASPQSVLDCAGAQSIEVTVEQTVTGKNFQLDLGGAVSGTVYQSDGVTPLTGKNIVINAFTGTPCGSPMRVNSAGVDPATGTYTILGLPAGTYYLQTWNENYINEWWASPQSVRDCAGAQTIVVTVGQTVTGKNFQLELGGAISGTIYQSDGVTPLTGKYIGITTFTGTPCGSQTWVSGAAVNPATGTYTTSGLPAGTYYLIAGSDEYIGEYWASPQSVRDCAGAQSIVVTVGQTVTGKNFQLELGGAVSGTVYQSDGVTPLTGKNISINVFTGSPCGSLTWVRNAPVFQANGTYTILGLPAGTYYLKTWSNNENYIPEFWASPQSVRDCAGAQSIVVTMGQTVTGKNFQLELGGAISGTIYQSDGVTPLTGKNIGINAFTGTPCGSPMWVNNAGVDPATGTYTIIGLPAGTYYLQTWSNNENYAPEWWASPQSVLDCASAQSIVVTVGQTVTGKNFQLDLGGAVSGTVYQSDGVTPLTGKNISINIFTGSPCGSLTWVGNAPVFQANGTYTILGLPAGTYYLQTWSNNEYYIKEFWASPQSVRDCASAQSVVVTVGQTVTGKNFQLELGGAISGTVYQSDGVTPLTDKNIVINAFTGTPCGSPIWVNNAGVDPVTGTYTILGLPAGTYYLSTWSNNENYAPEWWASPQSVLDCASAQSVVVTVGQTVTGKNFQLDLRLAASFDSLGLWIYNSGTAAWSQVSSANPENMIYSGSMLYADFGALYGLYKWDGAAWTQLTSANPENMVTSGSTLYVDFGASYGLYKWNGTSWARLTSANPENMVASGSALYVDFGTSYGLYKWDGAAWAQLTTVNPESMVTSGATLYVNFGAPYGLYKWDGAAWAQLTTINPESMVTSSATLYVNFGVPYGLYKWDGAAWAQLASVNSENMVSAGSTLLYADFGASYGLYKWDGAAWSQLTTANPENMVASGSILYVDFGALGLYKWDGAAWSQLTGSNPVIMMVSN